MITSWTDVEELMVTVSMSFSHNGSRCRLPRVGLSSEPQDYRRSRHLSDILGALTLPAILKHLRGRLPASIDSTNADTNL